MAKPVYRKKRSKATIILLAPILAFVFLVGWSLYCLELTGNKQKQEPITKTPAKPEEIELIMIPKEEQTLTA